MKRADILNTATDYVTRDRAADHGDLEDNFRQIASLWTVYLQHPVTAVDVGVMMTLLKVARVKGNPAHMDNFIDAAGYMACAGEIADAQETADD